MHHTISRRTAVTRLSHAAAGVLVARYAVGCSPMTPSGGGSNGGGGDSGDAGGTNGTGGTDAAAFRACLAEGDSAARIQRDVDSGQGLTVRGTPTFFVNGARFEGTTSAAEFNAQLTADPFDVPTNQLLVVAADDHVEGSRGAPGTIIEYGDFECPVCGQFFRDNLPDVLRTLVDTGRAKYVFRHFPLRSDHPLAEGAAQAAECAAAQGEENFFPYHDLLFENQLALETDDLEQYAAELGLA